MCILVPYSNPFFGCRLAGDDMTDNYSNNTLADSLNSVVLPYGDAAIMFACLWDATEMLQSVGPLSGLEKMHQIGLKLEDAMGHLLPHIKEFERRNPELFYAGAEISKQ